MGVRGYQYEDSGDAFSLAVEVPTFSFDSREYLLYNPEDTHVMASHDADLLLRTDAELVHYRGYYSARALDRPHWTGRTGPCCPLIELLRMDGSPKVRMRC